MTQIKEISAHSENVDKVVEAFGTSIQKGLSESEAKLRLEKYGKNELKTIEGSY